jgi:drug/metabolite transporter (DMT)-like permease
MSILSLFIFLLVLFCILALIVWVANHHVPAPYKTWVIVAAAVIVLIILFYFLFSMLGVGSILTAPIHMGR